MAVRKRIGDHSVGIQADRDVTVNVGLTVSEVERLARLFLRENFPKLREDAMRVARENVQGFLAEFERQLRRGLPELDTSRFGDPDVQFSINEAVLATARRGSEANVEILATLVLQRATKGNGELLSLACSDAIEIVPRLTREHIAFLSVALYFDHMTVPQLQSVTDFEHSARLLHSMARSVVRSSGWDRQYLESQRCLALLHIGRSELLAALAAKYPALRDKDTKEMAREIDDKTVFFKDLVAAYHQERLNFVRLTLAGQMIAGVNVDRIMPGSSDLNTMLRS